VELAERGLPFEGLLMAQWRTGGLRERAHILKQGWLIPDYGGRRGPDKKMVGLRVKQVVPGSFWNQLGLEVNDLIEEMNETRIDSINAWRKVLEYAQNDTDVTVVVRRDNDILRMRTLTVPPR